MKKKLVKAVSVAMALTMTAGLATGCNSSSGSGSKSSKKSTSGSSEGSVYWLNFKPEADEALQEIAKTYKEETGVSVKVVTAASGSYEETPKLVRGDRKIKPFSLGPQLLQSRSSPFSI